jgi:hypothetical protein
VSIQPHGQGRIVVSDVCGDDSCGHPIEVHKRGRGVTSAMQL